MGNTCHSSGTDNNQETTLSVRSSSDDVYSRINQEMPIYSQSISDMLANKKPFQKELQELGQCKKIIYNGNIYYGEHSTTPNKPHGFGKLYFLDGSILIGNFEKGEPKGNCIKIHKNASYHHGEIHNGKLNCEKGVFYSPKFKYIGAFKDNVYEGKGKLYKDNYILSGVFKNGKIRTGTLQWHEDNQKFRYSGEFDVDMQMDGQGVLEEPNGKYTGSFKDNQKHGRGTYVFKNGNIYSGDYRFGLKEGFGTLKNKFQETVYRGDWKEDIPTSNFDNILIKANMLQQNHKRKFAAGGQQSQSRIRSQSRISDGEHGADSRIGDGRSNSSRIGGSKFRIE